MHGAIIRVGLVYAGHTPKACPLAQGQNEIVEFMPSSVCMGLLGDLQGMRTPVAICMQGTHGVRFHSQQSKALVCMYSRDLNQT